MILRSRIFFLLSLFTLVLITASAQEGNIWYFGEYAGLNFNTTPPTPLTNGAINTLEGCASISNKRGQLLFYTDGIKVYNRNHQPMPNGSGLLGNSSSTQSAIIIPNPGDSNIYYIFTADCAENYFVNGYNYSVVDMRLDNNFGNVTSLKNINLYSPCTERLTAVKAANGIDYWVITKGLNNNRFTVYKVDCNGINLTPITSDVGAVHTFDMAQYVGCGQMKASPDGKKLCVPIAWPVAMAQLFDFNNITGKISNPIDLTGYTNGFAFIYGVEFSPDSRLLYVSTVFDKTINQYDITSNNAVLINASKYVINVDPEYPIGLQLTPDKRIFIAFPGRTNISVINNPNTYGPGCNYSFSSIDLVGRKCVSGFPAYIASFFDVTNHVDFTHGFVDCHVKFDGTTDLSGNLSWEWDFGDGAYAAGQSATHSYKKTGSYTVTLKVRSTSAACNLQLTDSFTVTKPVVINNVFSVDYGFTGTCVGQPTQFSDSTVLTIGSITNRTWNFGDGSPVSNALNPSHTYASTGMYKVKLLISTSGVCNADSIIKDVYIDTKPTLIFTAPNGCINQGVQFADNSVNTVGGVTQWKWYFGDGDSSLSKNPLHAYSNYGNYTVQLIATSAHGCAASPQGKPVVIDSKPAAAFDFMYPCTDKPAVFTNNSSNLFGSITYNWSFGDNSSSTLANPIHQYTQSLNYPVVLTVNTVNGCSTIANKTITVIPHFANAGRDTIALYNQPHQLLGSGTGSFTWAPAAYLNTATTATPIAKLKNDQLFTLQTVNADGCVATDNVLIKVVTNFNIYIPTAFTPNGDGLNDILKPVCFGIDHLNYFKIFNRYGQEIYSTKEMNKGWNGTINGTRQPQGAYIWMVQGVDIFGKIITHKGSTILLP